MRARRTFAWGGVAGPVGFVAAWALGGEIANSYSPVHDAISRLAAVDAPTQPLMTAGFVTFGVGVPLFGLALRERIEGPAWVAAVATGLATIGVALLPLDVSPGVDLAHGAAATAGYVTLAALPVLAASPLRRAGFPRAANASVAVGLFSGACLAATVLGSRHGLFQRAGLTAGDLWVLAAASWLLRDRA